MIDKEKVMQWLKICTNGCEDGCPYEYKNLVYRVECKVDLMSDALELLKEQEPSGWISVKDRLPEEDVWVLVWEKQGFAYGDKLVSGVWQVGGNNGAIITHWMPLPEGPEEVIRDENC